MTTTQIIISVCSFAVLGFVSMVVYVWNDLKSGVKGAVTQDQCTSKRATIDGNVKAIRDDLNSHYHTDDKKVAVKL